MIRCPLPAVRRLEWLIQHSPGAVRFDTLTCPWNQEYIHTLSMGSPSERLSLTKQPLNEKPGLISRPGFAINVITIAGNYRLRPKARLRANIWPQITLSSHFTQTSRSIATPPTPPPAAPLAPPRSTEWPGCWPRSTRTAPARAAPTAAAAPA
jgi:hypothetical protein